MSRIVYSIRIYQTGVSQDSIEHYLPPRTDRIQRQNKKLSYRRDSARCGWRWNGHSRSLKVIVILVPIIAVYIIYDFILALSTDLTTILVNLYLSRSWDNESGRKIVCTSIPYPTSLPGGTGKRRLAVGGYALVLEGTRTLDYLTINWNPR